MSSGGHYSEDFAELESELVPPWFGTLKAYWDGRDLVDDGGGVAGDWVPRAGSQQSTLVNLSDAATLTTFNGHTGVVGRMQVAGPDYTPTGASGEWSYFFVLKVPATFSGFQGVSAYYGKPLPFFWEGVALKSARGTNGVDGFEGAYPTMVADCSSWAGKLLSLVVVHKVAGIDFIWELDGTPGSASVTLAAPGPAQNSAPRGMTLGAFADSGGVITTPTMAGAIINGAPGSGEAEDLAGFGTAVWSA